MHTNGTPSSDPTLEVAQFMRKRRAQTFRLTAAALAVIVSVGGACKRDKKASALSELVEISTGSVDKSIAGKAWQQARRGDEFSHGDSMRTSADGSARIRIAQSLLDVGPSTIISFGEHVDVEGEIKAVSAGATLDLAIGEVELVAGAVLRLSGGKEGMEFEVLVGTAVVQRGDEQLSVEAGERVSLGEKGELGLERPADAGVADASSDPTDSSVPIVATATGKVTATLPGEESQSRLTGTTELAPGATLQLKRRARVDLVRGDQTATLYGPAVATIGEGSSLVSVGSGKLEARAGTRDVVVQVPGGSLRLLAGPGDGSAATVSVSRKGTDVALDRGRGELAGADGVPERLTHGEGAELSRSGSIEVLRRAPEHADASVTGSPAIHTPGREADVAIEFSEACPEEALVELGRNARFGTIEMASRGKGSANLRLSLGLNHYRVRCIKGGVLSEDVAFKGRIKVDRDAGTRKLASVPPTSAVEADGRRYTVLYQNKLPAIRFGWRDAPRSDSYSLVLHRKNAKPVKKSGKQPNFNLSSGVLREGEYTFQFESAKGKSRVSRLKVAFDNAASSAYISSPAPGSTWSGETVRVAGATIAGWRVRVNGQSVRLDGQDRFDIRVPRPQSGRIAIEFSHPRRGVHVYLRRSGDAP